MSSKSLKYLMLRNLETKLALGVSKKETKENLKARVSPNIHSIKTFEGYIEHVSAFANYIKNNNEISIKPRTLEGAKDYAQGYIDTQKSTWSASTIRSAIAKALNCEGSQLAEVSRREPKNITQHREITQKQETMQRNHPELVEICRSSGGRHSELVFARAKDVKIHESDVYLHVERSKGGKSRDVLIMPGPGRDALVCRASERSGNEHIFDKGEIPEHFDTHSLRAKGYACSCYDYAKDHGYSSGKTYTPRDGSGRVFDTGCLNFVSHNLGHNDDRFYTVVYSYLYNYGK